MPPVVCVRACGRGWGARGVISGGIFQRIDPGFKRPRCSLQVTDASEPAASKRHFPIFRIKTGRSCPLRLVRVRLRARSHRLHLWICGCEVLPGKMGRSFRARLETGPPGMTQLCPPSPESSVLHLIHTPPLFGAGSVLVRV